MNTDKTWPLNMAQASHIARIPQWKGSDAEIAREYSVSEALIRQIRVEKSYHGVNLG